MIVDLRHPDGVAAAVMFALENSEAFVEKITENGVLRAGTDAVVVRADLTESMADLRPAIEVLAEEQRRASE